MARKTDDKKLENIYNKVQEYPGKKAGFLARLPALEEKKLYVAEDDKGGLWPFQDS
jgi:hypothetical protein